MILHLGARLGGDRAIAIELDDRCRTCSRVRSRHLDPRRRRHAVKLPSAVIEFVPGWSLFATAGDVVRGPTTFRPVPSAASRLSGCWRRFGRRRRSRVASHLAASAEAGVRAQRSSRSLVDVTGDASARSDLPAGRRRSTGAERVAPLMYTVVEGDPAVTEPRARRSSRETARPRTLRGRARGGRTRSRHRGSSRRSPWSSHRRRPARQSRRLRRASPATRSPPRPSARRGNGPQSPSAADVDEVPRCRRRRAALVVPIVASTPWPAISRVAEEQGLTSSRGLRDSTCAARPAGLPSRRAR